MGEKMAETRFTIQFSRTDPMHLQAAEILNRQGRRSKAQYIAGAVLHYENCGERPDIHRTAAFDEKVIEAVVNRILQAREKSGADRLSPAAASPRQPKTPPQAENSIQSAEEISFDDALEALGQDGARAVAGMLDMFREKKERELLALY